MGSTVEELTALPGGDTPWYKQSHLRKLNFITLSMVLFCKFSRPRYLPNAIVSTRLSSCLFNSFFLLWISLSLSP